MAKKGKITDQVNETIDRMVMEIRQEINNKPELCKPETLNARLAKLSTETKKEVKKILITAKKN